MSGSTPSASTVSQAELQNLSNGELISVINSMYSSWTEEVRRFEVAKETLSQERKKRKHSERKNLRLVNQLQDELSKALSEGAASRRTAKQALIKNAAIVDALESDAVEGVPSSKAGVMLRLLQHELVTSKATIVELERAIRMSGRATTAEGHELKLLQAQREEDRDELLRLRAQVHEGDREVMKLQGIVEDLEHTLRLRETTELPPTRSLSPGRLEVDFRRSHVHRGVQAVETSSVGWGVSARSEAEVMIRQLRQEISALKAGMGRKETIIDELATQHGNHAHDIEVVSALEKVHTELRRTKTELQEVTADLTSLERTHKSVLMESAQLKQQCIELQSSKKKLERKIANFNESEYHRLEELLEVEQRYIRFAERRRGLEERDKQCTTLEQRVRFLENVKIENVRRVEELRSRLIVAETHTGDIEVRNAVLTEVVTAMETKIEAQENSWRRPKEDVSCMVELDDTKFAHHWYEMAVSALDCRFLEFEVKIRDEFCNAASSLFESMSGEAQEQLVTRLVDEMRHMSHNRARELPARLELQLLRQHVVRAARAVDDSIFTCLGFYLSGGDAHPLVVSEVVEGSAAAEGRLEVGMEIISINFNAVHTIESVESILLKELSDASHSSGLGEMSLLRVLIRTGDDGPPEEIVIAV